MPVQAVESAYSNLGQCQESLCPYIPAKIATLANPSDEALAEALTRKSKLVKIGSNETSIESELSNDSPVIIIIPVFDELFLPVYGFVDIPKKIDPNPDLHALLVVGKMNHELFGQAYVCRNSWGQSWGDDGDCYVSGAFLDSTVKEALVLRRPQNTSLLDSIIDTPANK